MSHEANKPRTQAGSEHFIEGFHPTDRVRPFKHGDLSDVQADLLEGGAPDTVEINPVTLDVEVVKIPINSEPRETDQTPRWKKWSVGALSAIVVAGLVSYTAHELTSREERPNTSALDTPPQPDATPTADQPTAEAEPKQETEQSEFGLRAEKYIDNPKGVMVDFVEAYNKWQNSGVTKDAASAPERFEMNDQDYAAKLNEASDAEFLDSMLIPNWESNPNLVKWVDVGINNHRDNSHNAIISLGTNPDIETEMYQRFIDLDMSSLSVVAQTEDTLVLSGSWAGRDNADENIIGKNRPAGSLDPNSEQGSWVLDFAIQDDGFILLSNYRPR